MEPQDPPLKRILFVDDEPNFLNGIRLMLRAFRGEWELRFAGSADEALAHTDTHDLDVIVSDVTMPGKNGLDLLHELRSRPRTANTPVIMLTGNAEADLKRRALDLGATDLLNKPVTPEDLQARIRSVLRLKAYQDQLEEYNATLERKVRERTAQLEHSHRDILWRLAKAGEFRDEETGDHVMRVASCSRILAEKLGLDSGTIEAIFLTSLLHDIGKIGIPDAILRKEGSLSDEERRVMQSHCAIGASILREAPKGLHAFLEWRPGLPAAEVIEDDGLRRMASEIALSHHEKWDGGGYPARLKGDAIPISGQIVAVSDVYDALRSERPYKKPFSKEETLSIMRLARGVHFAPDVFAAFETAGGEFERVRERHAN
ncbi:MAG: HD domain-containing phosphohydrolase [Candidatus Hydrogenedentota bacterium]